MTAITNSMTKDITVKLEAPLLYATRQSFFYSLLAHNWLENFSLFTPFTYLSIQYLSLTTRPMSSSPRLESAAMAAALTCLLPFVFLYTIINEFTRFKERKGLFDRTVNYLHRF